ncbi:hypothetical protein GCM10022198_22330 [Klugiella xanthotipulae]|uniref:DUF7507 domain-containing protein n=1 Tax=Klugiella xanthotipulae TaxID=244735 RepID=UPI001476D5DC|nr:hypothetical protein [Klugiella xanthotipulae]
MALAVVTLLAASVLLVTGAGAATAAIGDYTVEIEAPASVAVRQGFSYTVTVDADAQVGSPATGIVLTAQLAPGLAFEAVPVGPDSAVKSYTYDATTGVVIFTLRDLTESLSTFIFTVKPVEPEKMDTSTVLTTTLSGSDGPGGAVAPATASTRITGNLNYSPVKSAVTVVGSNNRDVTYYFNVSTDTPSEQSDTLTSWGQRLTDTLPAGATITDTYSSVGGAWTVTGSAATGQTAVWERTGTPYGPSQAHLDDVDHQLWITVNFPEGAFAAGITPPANVVALDVRDFSGTWQARPTATASSPAIIQGADKRLHMTKHAYVDGNSDNYTYYNGDWLPAFRVAGSFLNDVDSEGLDRIVLEDSSAQSAENADFYAQSDVYRLRVGFNSTLIRADIPYTFEYTTTASSDWKTYGAGLTTAQSLFLNTQTSGSNGFVSEGYRQVLNLGRGERITGWRVTVSPGATDAAIHHNSEVEVFTSYIPINKGAAGSSVTLKNTAVTSGVLEGGAAVTTVNDSATTTVEDQVPIITTIAAPASLTVGSPANYVANISNLDPVRSFDNSVMNVVLPVGVFYDPTVGVSRVSPTTVTSNIPVPAPGNGLTITTNTVTAADGDHQVVVFTFDTLESIRLAGSPKNRYEGLGFQYNVPVTVLAQAYASGGTGVNTYSVAYTNDDAVKTLRMGYWPSYYAADSFDLDANLTRVAVASAQSTVATAGGLLIGKVVRSDASRPWSTFASVASPGTADWQVYVKNVLTDPVSDLVVFDRMPFDGDTRNSDFGVTLTSPVTGAPAGSTVEYSVDATSADTGSWSTTPTGATAFRVTVPELNVGADFTLEVPATEVPAGISYLTEATNTVEAHAVYHSAQRSLSSNPAQIAADAHPEMSVVKKTNGIDVSAAPGAVVATGSTVEWTYAVTNDGDVALDQITVEDAFVDGSGATGTLVPTSTATGPLLPGQTRTFTASAPAIAGQYHNTATVNAVAVDDLGTTLAAPVAPAQDESWYLAGTSGLTVVKTTNGTDVASAPGPFLTPGDEVAWEYTVTNTGTLPLTNVEVADVDSAGDTVFTETIASLAPGQSQVLSATGTAREGQYQNTVTASARAPQQGAADLMAADDSFYYGLVKGITIAKDVSVSADGSWGETVKVGSGDSVYWRLSVTNTGNYPLVKVALGDPALGHYATIPLIKAGETVTRIIPQDALSEGYTNLATVTAADPANPRENLTAEDDASASLFTAPDELVITGADGGIGMLAGILLLGGGALLAARRRRRTV